MLLAARSLTSWLICGLVYAIWCLRTIAAAILRHTFLPAIERKKPLSKFQLYHALRFAFSAYELFMNLSHFDSVVLRAFLIIRNHTSYKIANICFIWDHSSCCSLNSIKVMYSLLSPDYLAGNHIIRLCNCSRRLTFLCQNWITENERNTMSNGRTRWGDRKASDCEWRVLWVPKANVQVKFPADKFHACILSWCPNF